MSQRARVSSTSSTRVLFVYGHSVRALLLCLCRSHRARREEKVAVLLAVPVHARLITIFPRADTCAHGERTCFRSALTERFAGGVNISSARRCFLCLFVFNFAPSLFPLGQIAILFPIAVFEHALTPFRVSTRSMPQATGALPLLSPVMVCPGWD